MNVRTNRPATLSDEHLEYLDDLRESGVTNMFGSAPYLRSEFPYLNHAESMSIVSYWMKTFTERHPKDPK